MFTDPFENAADSPMAPAEDCFAIVPSDTESLPKASKAIYVGTGGDIALVPVRGSNEVLFRNVPSGSILDVRVRAIMASGTSAADMVGLA